MSQAAQVMTYIQEKANAQSQKTQSELDIKRQELELNRERLDLDNRKFELEQREREQRLLLEGQERSMMIQLITKKLMQ